MGYSGHSYVVLDACQHLQWKVTGYCSDSKAQENPFDLNYLGNEKDADFDWNKGDDFILGIGDNAIRKEVYELLKRKGKSVHTVVHPDAVISSSASIEEATFVAAGAVVNPMANVGKNCIVNTGAIVEHECEIGDFSHIAPGAVLLGNVKVGKNCFIGAQAVIRENTTIADNVIIGAGSVVLKDVTAASTWVGNPAKKVR